MLKVLRPLASSITIQFFSSYEQHIYITINKNDITFNVFSLAFSFNVDILLPYYNHFDTKVIL